MKEELFIERVECNTARYNKKGELSEHAYLAFGRVDIRGRRRIQTIHFVGRLEETGGSRRLAAQISKPSEDTEIESVELQRGRPADLHQIWAKAVLVAKGIHDLKKEFDIRGLNCRSAVRTICDVMGFSAGKGESVFKRGWENSLATELLAQNPQIPEILEGAMDWKAAEAAIIDVRKTLDAEWMLPQRAI